MVADSEKYSRLKKQIDKLAGEDVIVAFSGGADSSFLLKLACQSASVYGSKVYAVTVQTMLHPKSDLEIAEKVAKETGALYLVLEIDELQEAGIENNPVDRCYRCKKSIFQKIKSLSQELGIRHILEGTNEDDLHVYRPGIRALKELEIISPLADCGITKEEVRRFAEVLGISVAKRAASPCLATRLPYGDTITYEKLQSIGAGESYIRELGFYNVRLRLHGEIVRIEVDAEGFSKLLEYRKEITDYLKKLGFTYITFDLEGFRSGSMDISLDSKRRDQN